MLRFDELDQQLAARGWHHDSANEVFRHRDRDLECKKIVGPVPELTLEERASHQDHKNDGRLARLAKVI
jgi:hypothetical protein